MNALIGLAVALALAWLILVVGLKVLGFAVHLALIAAVVLLIVWLAGWVVRRRPVR